MRAFDLKEKLDISWDSFCHLAAMSGISIDGPDNLLPHESVNLIESRAQEWRQGISTAWLTQILKDHQIGLSSEQREALRMALHQANLQLAEDHWNAAQKSAIAKRWDIAIQEGQQALQSIHHIDPKRHSQWTLKLEYWRIRRGELALAPALLRHWWVQRSLSTAVALVFLPILFLLGVALWTWSPRLHRDAIRAPLLRLLEDRSANQHQFAQSIAFFRSTPQYLQQAQTRIAHLLVSSKNSRACTLLSALHQLSPIENLLTRWPKDRYQQRFTSHLLKRRLGISQIQLQELRCTVSMPWIFLDGLRFTQLHWSHADLSLANFRRSRLSHGTFQHMRMQHTNFERTALHHTYVLSSDLGAAKFANASMQHSRFVATDLRFADFRNANLKSTRFIVSDLRNTRWEGAKTHYTDFIASLISSASIPYLRSQKTPLARHICLTQSFFEQGSAMRCYQWHRAKYLNQVLPAPTPPAHCPESLTGPIITFPRGQLQQEGQCPWHAHQN